MVAPGGPIPLYPRGPTFLPQRGLLFYPSGRLCSFSQLKDRQFLLRPHFSEPLGRHRFASPQRSPISSRLLPIGVAQLPWLFPDLPIPQPRPIPFQPRSKPRLWDFIFQFFQVRLCPCQPHIPPDYTPRSPRSSAPTAT